jgi:cell wall-associated NlpC family hydrolase
MRKVLVSILITLGLALGIFTGATPAAHAATTAPTVTSNTLGDRILNAAETRAGDWYQWGAAGPSTFDCSGLIVWAAARQGISIPHSTYSMLAGTAHLYRIPLSSARRGDILFYGSGHVEIKTAWYHDTFGAHHTGTRVGWRDWSSSYYPTMAMRFR